jgi:hypothetical protein
MRFLLIILAFCLSTCEDSSREPASVPKKEKFIFPEEENIQNPIYEEEEPEVV